MIQFSKLRLSGFKSFVDKTELDIGPGLNGIVGPNGCGKSNLVEAMRWVMGESSAKRMRGGGMEDVIFAGTDRRNPRNIAEVSLLLNNASRQAPAAYNAFDDIEVIRRIERDKGSGYKINGKNARARDVQMLFADTVTGSNSPALVSQGHVTRMINAKPHDRRLILEESAGISGLYARRHEAELRLKAADANLLRVEDVLGSMENRLNALKRQARQAARYKNLSAQIRQLELVITYLEWESLVQKQKDIKSEFARCESIVAEKLTTVMQLSKTQNTQIEDLPPLRKEEAEIAAQLQKLKLDFQRLEEEITRHKNDLHDAKTQLHQVNVDKQHEEQTLEESLSLLSNIEKEHAVLIQEQDGAKKLHEQKQEKRDSLKHKVISLEERYTALKESAAEGRAREESIKNQISRNQERMDVLQSRKALVQSEKETLVIDESSKILIAELEQKTRATEEKLLRLNSKTEHVREEIEAAENDADKSRARLSESEKLYAEYMTELSMLEKILENDCDKDFVSVLDSIATEKGFEKALSRAMGDSLTAALDENAPAYWQMNSKEQTNDLPSGVTSLLPHVKAPKELELALSQIGFVSNMDEGQALCSELKAGQSLVSADGYYWRWDGYHVQAHATDRHSVYLEQKNKLIALEEKRESFESDLAQSKRSLDGVLKILHAKKELYDQLLLQIKNTENTLKELHPALQKIHEKNLRIQSDQKRIENQMINLDEDINSLQETIDQDRIAYEVLLDTQYDGEHSDEMISDIKEKLDQTKEKYQDAVRDFDLQVQSENTRRARIQAIADERVSLKNRSIRAKEHLKKLNERAVFLNEKLEELRSKPIKIDKGQEEMLDQIKAIEEQRNHAADALAQCEHDVSVTNKALKESENILGTAREERAAAQAMMAAITEQLGSMESTIRETLNVEPDSLPQHSAVDLVKYQIHDLPKLKSEKEELLRSRDSIGAVNLRAEEEATELESELGGLLHERNDLIQAIEELRGGINKINTEARERLLAAFDHVNAHFQRLFVQLFSGGKAHLELIDSDDPLGAGLEIFAQPPGKSLQALSLLSGGEQTLASIALIFGMFLTNPSPICVLDEIDAPLDDANVDRVCDLLDEIAERGETRFLIITHHRLSMARMDRLYGVTMSEKGVSQLVSVDLQESFEFIDKKVA